MQPVALQGKAARAARIPDWARIVAYDGAVRSGKTIGELLMWASYCVHGPAGLLLIGGRTERTIANNLILPLQEIFGPERIVYTRATGRVSIFGRDCLVVGFNDESSREKIQGLTLAGALLDEAAVVPESAFQMLISRLSVPGARLFLTCNPEGPEHWLLKKFLERARLWVDKHGIEHEREPADDVLNLFRVTFLLDDNTWLVENNPEYIAELKKQYTGLWSRRMIESEWVAAEGAIYPMWDPDRHVIRWEDLPPLQRVLGVGMDYGTTNATVGIALGLTAEAQPRLVLIDEWRYDSRVTDVRLTDVELSERFRAWLAGLADQHGVHLEPEHIYLDPSAASFTEQLWKDQVRTWPADNDVAQGIADVASLLATDKLIVTDRCKGFIKEIPAYSWDDKATEKGLDKPLKVADHDMDASRYVIRSTKHLWQRTIGLR
jgi:phage terminase, large subunit, PBSX family